MAGRAHFKYDLGGSLIMQRSRQDGRGNVILTGAFAVDRWTVQHRTSAVCFTTNHNLLLTCIVS